MSKSELLAEGASTELEVLSDTSGASVVDVADADLLVGAGGAADVVGGSLVGGADAGDSDDFVDVLSTVDDLVTADADVVTVTVAVLCAAD
ncbi:hypothetical protein GCM10027572_08380 [Flexivirga lutea]